MGQYWFQEGSVDLPAGWADQSIQAFTIAVNQNQRRNISFTITRDITSSRWNPVEYADEQLVGAAKTFPGFELVERIERVLQGQRTIDGLFRWTPPQRAQVFQRQTYLVHDHYFLVFTITYEEHDAKWAEASWHNFLGSLALGTVRPS